MLRGNLHNRAISPGLFPLSSSSPRQLTVVSLPEQLALCRNDILAVRATELPVESAALDRLPETEEFAPAVRPRFTVGRRWEVGACVDAVYGLLRNSS